MPGQGFRERAQRGELLGLEGVQVPTDATGDDPDVEQNQAAAQARRDAGGDVAPNGWELYT